MRSSSLVRRGAVVNDLRDYTDVVRAIADASGHAVAHEGDVTRWNVAHNPGAIAVSAFEALDLLVNNGGLPRMSPVRNLTEQDWNRIVNVKRRAREAPMQAIIALLSAGAGPPPLAAFINATSETAPMRYPYRTAYGAGKTRTRCWPTSLAMELVENDVGSKPSRGATRTLMMRQMEQAFNSGTPFGPGALGAWIFAMLRRWTDILRWWTAGQRRDIASEGWRDQPPSWRASMRPRSTASPFGRCPK